MKDGKRKSQNLSNSVSPQKMSDMQDALNNAKTG